MRHAVPSVLLLLALTGPGLLAAEEPAPAPAAEAIAVEEALAHVGEECSFEFVVETTRSIPDKNLCFLNSCRDHRDEKNFTVVIFKGGLDRLKEDGIESPAEHFEQATIRVRGADILADPRRSIFYRRGLFWEADRAVIVKGGYEGPARVDLPTTLKGPLC